MSVPTPTDTVTTTDPVLPGPGVPAPVQALAATGVAVWLDDLSRERLRSGSLARAVRELGVVGVTTNPAIFQKALADGAAYADALRDLAVRGVDVGEAVRSLTATDVRDACDVLAEVWAASGGRDGRVSLEVDPRLAHDTAGTVAEARALWWLVDRPNLMVKIPATRAGLPAITEVLGHGISVNVTLIFSLARYDEVMAAFLAGLELARERGHDLSTVHSVASFFVSRVDTEVDRRLAGSDREDLRGRAAVANAVLAHRAFAQVHSGPRWASLAGDGALPQRPLWASTGVKDPAYPDTRYVVDLAAAGTVNTMPEPTLLAVADHGVVVGDVMTQDTYARADADLAALASAGLVLDDVTDQLEREGVASFVAAWESLLSDLARQLADLAG